MTTTFSGVGHTEDLAYVFDFGREGSKTDYLVRDRFVRLITNFAKYRNPTPWKDKLLNDLYWPANFIIGNIKQLKITDGLQVDVNPNNSNMEFWRDIAEKQGTPPFDTF